MLDLDQEIQALVEEKNKERTGISLWQRSKKLAAWGLLFPGRSGWSDRGQRL